MALFDIYMAFGGLFADLISIADQIEELWFISWLLEVGTRCPIVLYLYYCHFFLYIDDIDPTQHSTSCLCAEKKYRLF
ncbi:hypothetical protein J6590_059837 [Homalodisca vitripennis]|nr:hypothetical protein J6590_059837 [Homalodisca vitripennis]